MTKHVSVSDTKVLLPFDPSGTCSEHAWDGGRADKDLHKPVSPVLQAWHL